MGQATQLTPRDIERFTERLRAEHDRLMEMYASARPEGEDPLLVEPGDTADMATGETEVAMSLSRADVDHRRLAQVRRALRKLEEGTYGLSDLTQEPIPIERLEAIPWATANVEELGDQDAAPAGARTI
jgi:DnaK suppressor protein